MKSFQWLTPALAAALLWNAHSSANKLTAYAFSTTPPPAATATIHSIDNIPCHETEISISTLHQPITILEATLEGQDKLVDQVLMLEDERNQDTTTNNIVENDPYGSVLWPAARTVSEHITRDTFLMSTMTNVEEQSNKPTLLELGTGTGLVALAGSASNKYESIMATDYESVPLKLLDAAYLLNQNKVYTSTDTSTMTPIVTSLFDICNLSVPLPPADVVCAADILYEKSTGIALARRCIEALERGSRVVIGCSPGRPGRPAFLEELRRLMNPNKMKDVDFVDVEGTTCRGQRNSLICGEGSTSISVEPKKLLVAIMDLKPDCLQK
eukprot:scaffold15241_cov65-Cyclotella_meneghiniana.AAC.3